MEDRLCLKMARDSLKDIYRSVESGRHTLAGILGRLTGSEKPAEQPSSASFFAGILGRLVALEKELRQQIRELEDLRLNVSEVYPSAPRPQEHPAKYRLINEKLVQVEKRIKQDFERLLPQCEQMRKDGVIDDFEIEAEVSLWLDEKDPAHRDDDDNIMAVSRYNAWFYADSDFGLDDRKNHNDCQFFDGDSGQGEHHCRLFHELYNHKELWDDILRADMIWLDVVVRRQNFYYLKKKQPDKN